MTRAAAAGATVHSNSWHALLSDPGDPAPYDLVAADVDTFTWTNEEQLVPVPRATRENSRALRAARRTPCASPRRRRTGPRWVMAPRAHRGRTPEARADDDRLRGALGALGHGLRHRTALRVCEQLRHPLRGGRRGLLRQHLGGTPSGALLKALLIGATDAPTGLTVPDARTGWGTVRLACCLAPELVLWDVRKTDGLVTGERRSLTVDVAGPELRVVLTWTEPPGTPGAATAMINELVLEVRPPSGASLRGDLRRRGVPATQTNGAETRSECCRSTPRPLAAGRSRWRR